MLALLGSSISTVEIVRFDRYSMGSTTCGVAEKLQSRTLVANICHESTTTAASPQSFTLGCSGTNGAVSFVEYATGNCTGGVVNTDDFALDACESLNSTLRIWSYPVAVRACEQMASAPLIPTSGSTAAGGVGIMKTYFYESSNGVCSPFLDTDYIVLGQCESQFGAWAPTGGIGSLRRDCEVKLTAAGTYKYDITLRMWDNTVHDCGESAGTAHSRASTYFGHRNVCWNVGGAGYENYPDFAPAGCYADVDTAVAAIDPLDPRSTIPIGPIPTPPSSPTPTPNTASNSQTGDGGRKAKPIDLAQVIIWSVLGGGFVIFTVAVLLATLLWYVNKKQRQRDGGRVNPAGEGVAIGLGVLNPAHADARNGIAVAELVVEDFERNGDAVFHNPRAIPGGTPAMPIIDAHFHADDDDDLPVAALVAVNGMNVADRDVVEILPVRAAPAALAARAVPPGGVRPSFIAQGAVRRVDASGGGSSNGGNDGRDIFVASAGGGGSSSSSSSSGATPTTQEEEEEAAARAKSAATVGTPIDL